MIKINDDFYINPDNIILAEQKNSTYKLTLESGRIIFVDADVYAEAIQYEGGGGGGTTYIAGNGITINNKTINADIKVLRLPEGMQSLTYDQALTLNLGDILIDEFYYKRPYTFYSVLNYSDRIEYEFISMSQNGTYGFRWTKFPSSWSYHDRGYVAFPVYYGSDGISVNNSAISNTRTLYTLNLDFGNNGNVTLMSELNYSITEPIDSFDPANMGEIIKLYNYLTDYNERIIEVNNHLSNSSYIEVVKTETGDPRYGTQEITQTIYLKTTSGGSTTTLVEVSVMFNQRSGYSIVNTIGNFTISPYKRLFPKTIPS